MDGEEHLAVAVRPAPGHRPFTLQPIIQDMLRMRHRVPGTIFLVENIQTAPVSQSGRWQTIQLLLGDGEHCIQTLLDGTLHRLVHTGEVAVGTYIRADDYSLRWKRLSADGENAGRQMVYLVVEDLTVVGWNDDYRFRWEEHVHGAARGSLREELTKPEEPHVEKITVVPQKPPKRAQDLSQEAKPSPRKLQTSKFGFDEDDAAIEDAFDAFDAKTFPVNQQRTPTKQNTKKPDRTGPSGPEQQQPIAMPRDWHNPQHPLKLTTLRSVPRLPYAQNWSCNVLAIIASLGPIEASRVPPHRQRSARLADPSTTKQVHLTVFLDPEGFEPRVGSAVLLLGVKNHRFDGGSLKKYASDATAKTGAAAAGKWWFEDPWELDWCDVAGIKSWWEGMKQTT